MKKSDCYKMAQMSILQDGRIADRDKLVVLRVLMDAENLALYIEMTEQEGECL